MTKHYTIQHTCGCTGIGPLIRLSSIPGEVDQQRTSSNATTSSIQLSLPLSCPFCANTQPYLNVAPGDGLLVILEPSSTPLGSPSASNLVSSPSIHYPYEWRALRVCCAHEITSEDWHLAHQPDGQYRQMAWIPKPCGTARIFGEVAEVRRRGGRVTGMTRQVDCSWRQRLREGEKVRTRLPGMFSSLKASLLNDVVEGPIGGNG